MHYFKMVFWLLFEKRKKNSTFLKISIFVLQRSTSFDRLKCERMMTECPFWAKRFL